MLVKICGTKVIFLVLMVSLLLNACSNVTMGFEKESIFYTKETAIEIPKREIKEDKIDEDIDNPTTFYYNPYEGE